MLFNIFRKVITKSTLDAPKMVIVVRTDLKMNSGKIASQCAHAAVTLFSSSDDHLSCQTWLRSGQPKIILKVNSEEKLMNLYNSAKSQNLNACLIYDAGRTQVKLGTLTTMGLGPNSRKEIDLLTKNLSLL